MFKLCICIYIYIYKKMNIVKYSALNFRDWYKSANCRPWYRREVLNNAFTHPSKMVYPPGEEYYFPENLSQRLAKPSGTRVPVATEFPSREPLDYEVGHFKSESQ